MCCGIAPRPRRKPPFVLGPVAPGDGSTGVECLLDTVPTAAQSRAKSPGWEHPHDSQSPGVDSVPAIEPRHSSVGGLPSDSEEDWVSDDEHYWGPGCFEDDNDDATGDDKLSETLEVDQYLFEAKANALRAMDVSAVPVQDLRKVLGREAAFDAVLWAAKTQERPALIEDSVKHLWTMRKLVETEQALATQRRLVLEFENLGILPPALPNQMSARGFNLSKILAHSEYLRSGAGSLADLIRLIRGQSVEDPRPDKALIIPDANFQHKAAWIDVVQHGAVAEFSSPLPVQTTPPRNHKSWSEAWEVVIPDIAKGAKAGEYLILDGDVLPMLMANGGYG